MDIQISKIQTEQPLVSIWHCNKTCTVIYKTVIILLVLNLIDDYFGYDSLIINYQRGETKYLANFQIRTINCTNI